jgi:GTPase SAR1 family protein
MFRRKKEVKSVVFLGVGGVGKTTYIYRLLGITKEPRVTRRPGVYQLATGDHVSRYPPHKKIAIGN